MFFTIQIHAYGRWQTYWVDVASGDRDDALDAFIDEYPDAEHEILETPYPILVRPSAYKEWIRDPDCGCPKHATAVA
jgi:ribosomal 50S subunit-associated protein YjgA (DUF615 family)